MINVKNGKETNPLFSAYVIVSPSMVPTIDVNDAIVIKRIDNDKYNVGDIITFNSADYKYKGLTVTHRIVGEQNISTGDLVYRTKGDNNRIEDAALVAQSSIYGRVILKLPKIGYVSRFIKTPLGFLIFVVSPIVVVFLLNRKSIDEFRARRMYS